MSAKPTPPTAAGGATPLNILGELARQQVAVATDASCAMFRGFEAMRKIQLQAAHHASGRHQAAAEKLHGGCAPMDLFATQASLLRDDLQSASRYWQDLAGAALEMQTEMMGCASHLLDSETALESVSAIEALDLFPGVKAFLPARANAAARARRAA